MITRKMKQMTFWLWALLLLCGSPILAQEAATVKVDKVSKTDSVKIHKHTPTKAMLCSIIPGGGQIYNKKYWKLPIVYGLIGASSYCIYWSYNKMDTYRSEYINRRDGNDELLNPLLANRADETILESKNTYERYMELSIGVTAILYALNIVDAMVDAHLFYFDVSDDLSLQWSPALMPTATSNKPTYGLSLQFKF